MRRGMVALGAALVLWLVPMPASADSGSYTTNDGLLCNWTGFGNQANVFCSGYSWRAGGYVNYSCDYQFFGGSTSWSCHDMRGNYWSGSR
jgi:hypothetical protein